MIPPGRVYENRLTAEVGAVYAPIDADTTGFNVLGMYGEFTKTWLYTVPTVVLVI
jgi:hypothetical protein